MEVSSSAIQGSVTFSCVSFKSYSELYMRISLNYNSIKYILSRLTGSPILNLISWYGGMFRNSTFVLRGSAGTKWHTSWSWRPKDINSWFFRTLLLFTCRMLPVWTCPSIGRICCIKGAVRSTVKCIDKSDLVC